MKSKTMHTRLAALLLVLTMLLGSIWMIGCADEKTPDNPDSPNTPNNGDNGDNGNNGDNGDDSKGDERIPTNLPEKNFDGASYHIFQWTIGDQTTPGTRIVPWEEGDVEATNGGLLNDAVFDRNATVEQTYNVVITMEYGTVDGTNTPFFTTFRNNHNTGEDLYQLATMRTYQTQTLALEGLMTDMALSEYINLSQPWWNDDSVESLKVGNHVYWAISEFLVRDKGATACIFYNTRIASDNGIDNLYQLAYDGTWTMDALIQAAETCYFDNGNGVADDEDIWGACCSDDTNLYLYNGAGLKFATVNEEGYPEYVFGDDTSVNVMMDIFDLVMYADWYAHTGLTATKDVKFENENVLFRFGMVKEVNSYRDMKSNYGILPIPKYDEYQDNYSSLVWMHHDCVLGIPAVVQNQEMAQIVTEALSAESYYTVYRKFYDTIILDRSARDQESKEMLEVIFDTRSIDPGQVWDPTGFANTILRLPATGSSNISSTWKSAQTATETKFNKTIPEQIDKLG